MDTCPEAGVAGTSFYKGSNPGLGDEERVGAGVPAQADEAIRPCPFGLRAQQTQLQSFPRPPGTRTQLTVSRAARPRGPPAAFSSTSIGCFLPGPLQPDGQRITQQGLRAQGQMALTRRLSSEGQMVNPVRRAWHSPADGENARAS